MNITAVTSADMLHAADSRNRRGQCQRRLSRQDDLPQRPEVGWRRNPTGTDHTGIRRRRSSASSGVGDPAADIGPAKNCASAVWTATASTIASGARPHRTRSFKYGRTWRPVGKRPKPARASVWQLATAERYCAILPGLNTCAGTAQRVPGGEI